MKLIEAKIEDAERMWQMQVSAFTDLYEKYQDTETSPATEKLEKVIARFNQPFTHYYFLEEDGEYVGGIRIVDSGNDNPKRISPIFIMKEHRNKGYASKAISLAEEIYGSNNWELDTILQEEGNCHLYEKMGYKRTDRQTVINDKMTLVFYKKD